MTRDISMLRGNQVRVAIGATRDASARPPAIRPEFRRRVEAEFRRGGECDARRWRRSQRRPVGVERAVPVLMRGIHQEGLTLP
jgi:hypothetical protein